MFISIYFLGPLVNFVCMHECVWKNLFKVWDTFFYPMKSVENRCRYTQNMKYYFTNLFWGIKLTLMMIEFMNLHKMFHCIFLFKTFLVIPYFSFKWTIHISDHSSLTLTGTSTQNCVLISAKVNSNSTFLRDFSVNQNWIQ